MLRILILVLAWIAITSCAKPEYEKVCGYEVNIKGFWGDVKCLTEPAKRPDGLFQCVNSESKLVAMSDVRMIQEGCW